MEIPFVLISTLESVVCLFPRVDAAKVSICAALRIAIKLNTIMALAPCASRVGLDYLKKDHNKFHLVLHLVLTPLHVGLCNISMIKTGMFRIKMMLRLHRHLTLAKPLHRVNQSLQQTLVLVK